jgi:F0F1-type ATP synthase membrane subunit a
MIVAVIFTFNCLGAVMFDKTCFTVTADSFFTLTVARTVVGTYIVDIHDEDIVKAFFEHFATAEGV